MTLRRLPTPTALAAFATLVIGVLIAVTTLAPAGDGPPLPVSDKALHAIAFGLFVLPMGWVRFTAMAWLAPLAVIYGGVIEVIQPHFGRGAEWGDLLADGIGVGLGMLPGYLRHRRRGA